jgi:hypothetical protein
VGLFSGRDTRRVAVVVTTDGRRVHVPLSDPRFIDVSALGLIRSLALSLLELITGSRRETGGPR